MIPPSLARLIEAANTLSFAAQITGGTAGRDDNLVAAIDAYTKARDEALPALQSMTAEEPVALKDAVPVVVKELRAAAARIGDAGLINEAVQYGLLAGEVERILGGNNESR